MIESESQIIGICLVKVTLNLREIEIFIIYSVTKSNPWTYKIKDLKGEEVIGIFLKKYLLFSIL